ncbi:hypothetical protein MBANPS3_003967 [Mucor bainieri]
MPNDLTGRFVYLVTFGVRRDDKSIRPESDGGGAVFNTRAEAETFMHSFGKELYWTNMDYMDFDEDEEYPEPDCNGCNREYNVEKNSITMGTESTGDSWDAVYAFVKISKVRVGSWLAFYDGEVHENITPPSRIASQSSIASPASTTTHHVQNDALFFINFPINTKQQMADNLTDRFVYLATFAIRRDGESIDPESDGGGTAFNTRAEAKTFMDAFGRELYWTNMDPVEFDEDEEEYPEPDCNGCYREYYVQENNITMGTHSADGWSDNHAYAFVKISKVRVGSWLAFYDGKVHENMPPPGDIELPSGTATHQVQSDGVIIIDDD